MKFHVVVEVAAPAFKIVVVEANDEETAKSVAVKACEAMDSGDFSLTCPATGFGSTEVLEPLAILVLSEEEVAEAAAEELLTSLLLMAGAGGVQ